MLTGVVEWLVLGLAAGFIASKLIDRTGAGVVTNIVLGVIGALVGGLISTRVLHGPPVSGLNIPSLVIAAIGAAIVLLGYHMVYRRRRLSVGEHVRRALRR
jgi:uncharacterized membrane protein YeaQ/YmgE (transglycosylase-associated protein family)